MQVGGVSFVLIPKGEFTQGSPASEAGREADESERKVTIAQDFYMSAKPVSRGEWQRFVNATRYRTEAEKGESGGFGVQGGKLVQSKQYTWKNPGFAQTDSDPVVMVTWDDSQAYCKWLSAQAGRRCGLPTEAQWEYACRAGTTTMRYAEPVNEVAWHRGNSAGTTHPLGGNKPNAWGLYDLYGPVWQWCADWYAPYEGSAAMDPVQRNSNLSDKPRRVLRGGSFLSDANHARSAERYRNDAKSRNADNGFRVVAVVERIAEAAPGVATTPPTQKTKPVLAQSEPVHPRPSYVPPPSAPFGFLSIIKWIFFPLVLLFIFVRALGRMARGVPAVPVAPQQMGPSRFTTRMGIDGFWIEGPADAAGQIVNYSYVVDGVNHKDQVAFTPGPDGHYIVTGQRPQNVSMFVKGAVIGSTMESMHFNTRIDDDDDRPRRVTSTPSFPRAY